MQKIVNISREVLEKDLSFALTELIQPIISM